VRHKGDWAEKVKNVEPGGWYFEFNNEFYPDVDDTGEVLLALKAVQNPRERYQHEVEQRAINWVLAMQCRNGGWAAFDKDNTKKIFQEIPFADHNAMLDPPTVDITGRILEMLACYGFTRADKRVEKAVQFILKEQESDGSWLWPLGRELSVRNVFGAARAGGDGVLVSGGSGAAGGGVDSDGAESGWRVGRDLRDVR